jgi:hypothetical protein
LKQLFMDAAPVGEGGCWASLAGSPAGNAELAMRFVHGQAKY